MKIPFTYNGAKGKILGKKKYSNPKNESLWIFWKLGLEGLPLKPRFFGQMVKGWSSIAMISGIVGSQCFKGIEGWGKTHHGVFALRARVKRANIDAMKSSLL